MKDFELGKVLQTRGLFSVLEDNEEAKKEVQNCLIRYIRGDWGDLVESDKQLNNMAIENGDRILARYFIKSLKRDIYIITEWDRSVTTLLFTNEY